MTSKRRAAFILFSALLSTSAFAAATITARNDLDVPRPSETIELKWADVEKAAPGAAASIGVVDSQGQSLVSQAIDLDGDGKPDELVFQTNFAAGESKTFTLDPAYKRSKMPPSKVFCRFVPERLDDFAWESDKIAFRTYGPALEKADPAGSGIDVWCKKTPDLIVNKWYKLAEGPSGGYYHIDHGEGLDCYKTGHARGAGGTAVYKDGKLLTSGVKGFKSWKVLANGPVRIVFELTYEPWDAAGEQVSEVKRITLDAGHNLNRYESTFTTDNADKSAAIPIAIGLQHHEKPGTASVNKDQGWIRYWDAGDLTKGVKDNGNIGVGAVIDPANATDMMDTKDHVLIITRAQPGQPITFYAGAGWDKNADFPTVADWDKYLAQCAKRVQSPIKLSIGQ